jgi:hypothetical protein
MSFKKLVTASMTFMIISSGCAVPNDLNNVPPRFLEADNSITQVQNADTPSLPKLRLKINQAEIEIAEDDLNQQLKSILELSDEKRIKDTKMIIKPDSKIDATGIIEQKLPIGSKPLKIPFSIEGKVSAIPKNTIKYEVVKVKVAGIPVKALMDVLGLELANFTKFKDKYGRIELSGNSFLLIVEKFTDDAIIDGQIKKIQTGNKSLKVIF